jgi:hypothetical protein
MYKTRFLVCQYKMKANQVSLNLGLQKIVKSSKKRRGAHLSVYKTPMLYYNQTHWM